jgi:hypothetical protein
MYGKVQVRCRVAIGDWIYARKKNVISFLFIIKKKNFQFDVLVIQETILQPVSRTHSNSSEHLKVLFVRGNEKLVDGVQDVGGQRVYGGAVLSKNVKNRDLWLKVSERKSCVARVANLYFYFISP